MPRLDKIYTRTGDDGSTGLGTGERVPKTSPRVVAYGTVDELNAQLGVALAAKPAAEVAGPLRRIQNELLHIGAQLSMPGSGGAAPSGRQIEARHVAGLEQLIDGLNAQLEPLKNFVLPGGHAAAAQLHVARTICRRAERVTVRLAEQEPVGEHLVPYLNRLSDLLFVMARYQNKVAGVDEPLWHTHA
jgi:cob(I)alamin adenosyltransferase